MLNLKEVIISERKVNTMKRKKKGFTLIELIAVIAILGILTAILVPKLTGFSTKANTAADNATAKTINTAVTSLIADGTITGTSGTVTTTVTSAGVATFALTTGLTDTNIQTDMANLVGSTIFEKGGAKTGYVTTVATTGITTAGNQ